MCPLHPLKNALSLSMTLGVAHSQVCRKSTEEQKTPHFTEYFLALPTYMHKTKDFVVIHVSMCLEERTLNHARQVFADQDSPPISRARRPYGGLLGVANPYTCTLRVAFRLRAYGRVM
jgi:hypothetical protein